jgi:hypothetical protein
MNLERKKVYVFHGANARFCSAVFSSIEEADNWIGLHGLSGVLTTYILDLPVYKWAVEENFFEIEGEQHTSPSFIQKFTSAYQEHYHYEKGQRK